MSTRTITGFASLAVALSLITAPGTASAGRHRHAIGPDDFPSHSPEKVELGKVLFYDKILSGNRNTSCATCHHSLTDSGDGLSLPVGEGGRGLGVARDTGTDPDAIHERVPRNAPFLFNLGAYEFIEMFHDGRVEVDPSQPSGYRSPAGDDLPMGLESALAVQAMFPVTSGTEMAGQRDDDTLIAENPIAEAAANGDLPGVWAQLAERLRANEEYVELFKAAYPGKISSTGDNISYVDAANAIAAYEDVAFRAIDSPYDRFLRGERGALSREAMHGMFLFNGKAGCATCHSGPLQTDHAYHAIAMPQIGPGKGDTAAGGDSLGDFGRAQVAGFETEMYKFRTPSLRNTALTGPWGHDGAYNTLEAVVRHHLDPVDALESYDTAQAILPYREDLTSIDFLHHEDSANRADIALYNELAPVDLSDTEVKRLIAFLHALTAPSCLDLRHTMPMRVPSGLPLAD